MWKRSIVWVVVTIIGAYLTTGMMSQADARARSEQRSMWVVTRGQSAGRQMLVSRLEAKRMTSAGIPITPLAGLNRNKRLLSEIISYLHLSRSMAAQRTGVNRAGIVGHCTRSARELLGELRSRLAKSPNANPEALAMLDDAARRLSLTRGASKETIPHLTAATKAARDAFVIMG
jgi:hypothetical protein